MAPLFSIVIPTRNRAHLLPWALQSALDQTYGDFELVVSDDFSEDATPEVVQRCEDKRIRYVRTPTRLYVNDAWEFALAQAHGDYICTLPDDCALTPRFLEKLAAVISQYHPEMICFDWARYYGSESHLYPGVRNEVHVEAFTGYLLRVDAGNEIHRRFQSLEFNDPTPYVSNVCYHRSFVERVKAKAHGFCLPPNCEHVASTLALGMVDELFYLDYPIYVYGQLGDDSLTIAYRGKDPNFRTLQQLDYQHVPLAGVYGTNRRAESLLVAKNRLKDELADAELNWSEYFCRYYQEIQWFRRRGADVEEDLAEFMSVVGQQPPEIRASVQAAMAVMERPRSQWRRTVRGLIDKVGPLKQVESFLRRAPKASGAWPAVVLGQQGGFTNVLECAQRLEVLVSAIPPANSNPMWPDAKMLECL